MRSIRLPPPATVSPTPTEALRPRSVTQAAVPGYTYLGCYSDDSSRILAATSTDVLRNNPDYCCQWCINVDLSNTLCGVEDGRNCFCDSTVRSDASLLPSSACNSACPGAGNESCGGLWAMNLYTATAVVTSATPTGTLSEQIVPNYSNYGCYTDTSISGRVLNAASTTALQNNPNYCCEWCIQMNVGFRWCGVENRVECYCDSAPRSIDSLSASSSDCNAPCPGGADYQCGGTWRMNLYSATGVMSTATTTTTTTTTGSTTPTSSSGTAPAPPLSGGAIAGIVVGVVLFVSALLYLAIRYRRTRASHRRGNNGNDAMSQGADPAGTDALRVDLEPKEMATPYNTTELDAGGRIGDLRYTTHNG